MATLRSIGARRRRLLRIRLRRDRATVDLQTRPARRGRRCARSSDRTATASSTRSIASRCGPTSTACTSCGARRRHRVAERQRRRQPHVPTTRSAPRHDRLRRQPGQRRHGGLHRRVPRRPAHHRDRPVPRGGPRPAALRRRCRARAHAQGVPIVALQTGRSATGAAIATSHTGSMSGRAAAYDALFARYGVATVTTPAEMLETLKLLDNGGRLSGPRIVSMSCSGGEASLVADRTEGGPLRFEPFTDRAPTADRVDPDRAGHRQQPVRLPHLHVGRPSRDIEVLHGRDGRPAGRHDAGARRAAEPRQRPVIVDRLPPTRWRMRPTPPAAAR